MTHEHLTSFVQQNEVNACVKQQIFPAKIVTDVQKALKDFQHVLCQAEIIESLRIIIYDHLTKFFGLLRLGLENRNHKNIKEHVDLTRQDLNFVR